jgi:tetratricopeptide (TPR) repeat protein
MKSTVILILFIFSINLCSVLAQRISNIKYPPTLAELRFLIDSANHSYTIYPEKAQQIIEQVKQCLQTRTEQDKTIAQFHKRYFQTRIEQDNTVAELYKQYPQTWTEQDNTMAELYHQVGAFHYANDENTNEALLYFKKALMIRKRIFSASPQHCDLGRSFYMVACCQQKQGDYVIALTNVQMAYNIFEKIEKTTKFFGLCLTMTGCLTGYCGDNENAKKHLLTAIDLWKELNNASELARAENELAIIFNRHQQYESAIQHTQIAIHLIDRLIENEPTEKKKIH